MDLLNLFQDSETDVENNEANVNKRKELSQLKKRLKAVHKKIQSLEEKEMNIDNDDDYDENSPYILKDKYEKIFVNIYKRICKITETTDYLQKSKLRFQGTNNELVNKTVERYYNVTELFPNYYEIYTLLKILRDSKKLNWTESKLENISNVAFLKLGKTLKIKRLSEYFDGLSHLATEADPAENNLELKKILDESNEKLRADLNALSEKYVNMQEYAEETEGSCLNDTECENSSDDESSYKNQLLNNRLKSIKAMPIKRKRVLSNKLENNEPKKKSLKTIYKESFNITSRSVDFEPLNNLVSDKTNVNVKKVLGKIVTKETINDNVQSNKTGDDLKNITNDISENSNHTSSFNAEEVTNDVLNIVTENGKNNDEYIGSYDLAAGVDTDGNDSDVEANSVEIRKVPVHNKKTLESIIKSMNLHKMFNVDQAQTPNQKFPSISIQRPLNSVRLHSELNTEREYSSTEWEDSSTEWEDSYTESEDSSGDESSY